jgi:vacuolar-type H+-ATPase subunit I/STV1
MPVDPNTVTTPSQQPAGSSADPKQAPGAQSPGVSNGADSTEEKASRNKLEEGLNHHKSRADAAEARLKELESKNAKSEQERAEKQGEFEKLYRGEQEKTSSLSRKLETTLKSTALLMEATKLGIVDADTIALVDLEKVKVDGDKVVNAAEVMAKFKESKPHLFGNGKNGTPFTTPAANPGGLPNGKISVADVHKMTPEQRKEFLSRTKAGA